MDIKEPIDLAGISGDDVELLAYLLQEQIDAPSPSTSIVQRTSVAAAPLSFAQRRLWFLDQLEPGASAYNIPLALRLHGELQVRAFAQALAEIVRRHEVLRTTFAVVDNEPLQMIAPFAPPALPCIDLTPWSSAAREAELRRLISAEAQQSFDLARGPIMRTSLIKLGENEHVFLFNIHHIAADAWSLELFFRELAVLYKAFVQGQASPLPELSIQYADFAQWQQEYLQGERLDQHLAYWRQQLAGAPPILELPADHPRPAVQTFPGAYETFVLPKALSDALQKLSQQHQATLFMTLLTAFKILLYRYSGQDDLVVGSPIANRNRAELEELLGMFVNTLVLRTSLRGDPAFAEVLARVNETALAAYAHQDLPFEKLVEELQPERNLSAAPFFQVMFIYQNVPEREAALAGLTFEFMESYSGAAKFDLTLTMTNLPKGLFGAVEYNTDLFDTATIRRLLKHFETLLGGIVANPQQRISRLPLLPSEESRQLLHVWNETKRDYPPDACFHHVFEAQVERTPEAVALVFDEQQLTYRELNYRANRLAHDLRQLGVGPEVLVGICVERSLEMVVGLLGILKAGGAYVPLDPAYPPDRIALVLADARVPVLLTQQSLIPQLPEHDAHVICLDLTPRREINLATNPHVAVSGENLAYAIYTSGSTGKPKGVGIPHRALANFLHTMREAPGLSEHDKLLAVTTLSFDIAGLELYLPLTAGGCAILASREAASDGRQLITALANTGANVMQATPASWRMLVESGWPGQRNLKILCGGEGLPRELAQQLLERCGELWNMYGPTETTIWSTISRLDKNDDAITIGRPIANTEIFLLDRHLQMVPTGVHGALHIGGEGLARGYLHRPELTAEKFLPNPFVEPEAWSDHPTLFALRSSPSALRLYNTGDVARYLADGKIDCLGRSDHQVKIRGFRIELGEIEAICSQHPAIKEVVVVAREDAAQQKRLVAYLVAAAEEKPAVSELRRHLLKHLPEYMAPSFFVFLEALPLTPNGKVDRNLLPAPEPARTEIDARADENKNPVEFLLAEIWVELLGLTKAGLHDNFFELGGHSLLAVRLFLEIERSFNRSLPLASIFKAPTIKQLAALICDAEAAHAGCLVTLQEKGGEPPLFFVSGYEGHTFIFRQLVQHLGDDQPAYGLHYPGLEGEQKPLERIEDIAAEFIHYIRRVQPAGPYHLAGLCYGGLVGYEVAQQLTQQGETVDTLVLFDAMAPDGVRRQEEPPPAGLHDEASEPAHDESLREHAALGQNDLAERDLSSAGHAETALSRWIEAVRLANMRAHRRYRPRPYPGQILLFLPTKRGAGWKNLSLDPLNGWGELARGGVEAHAISGYHNNMFREPKVQRLAKKIRANLIDA